MVESTISLDDKKKIIIDFLEKCNQYSEQMLLKYQQEIPESAEADNKVIEKKLNQWETYREFNIHAIDELKTGQLDFWF